MPVDRVLFLVFLFFAVGRIWADGMISFLAVEKFSSATQYLDRTFLDDQGNEWTATKCRQTSGTLAPFAPVLCCGGTLESTLELTGGCATIDLTLASSTVADSGKVFLLELIVNGQVFELSPTLFNSKTTSGRVNVFIPGTDTFRVMLRNAAEHSDKGSSSYTNRVQVHAIAWKTSPRPLSGYFSEMPGRFFATHIDRPLLVQAKDGRPPYAYQWSAPPELGVATDNSFTFSTPLQPGDHVISVLISDADGQQADLDFPFSVASDECPVIDTVTDLLPTGFSLTWTEPEGTGETRVYVSSTPGFENAVTNIVYDSVAACSSTETLGVWQCVGGEALFDAGVDGRFRFYSPEINLISEALPFPRGVASGNALIQVSGYSHLAASGSLVFSISEDGGAWRQFPTRAGMASGVFTLPMPLRDCGQFQLKLSCPLGDLQNGVVVSDLSVQFFGSVSPFLNGYGPMTLPTGVKTLRVGGGVPDSLYYVSVSILDSEAWWVRSPPVEVTTAPVPAPEGILVRSDAGTGVAVYVEIPEGAERVGLDLLTVEETPVASEGVIISEYGENGVFKYIELTNIGDVEYRLSDYTLKIKTNGANVWSAAFQLPDVALPPSGSFVAFYSSSASRAHAPLVAFVEEQAPLAILTTKPALNFNGNDVVGLFYNGLLSDSVGVPGMLDEWGEDCVLRRKPSVIAPSADYFPEEWFCLDFPAGAVPDFSEILSHGWEQWATRYVYTKEEKTAHWSDAGGCWRFSGLTPGGWYAVRAYGECGEYRSADYVQAVIQVNLLPTVIVLY